MKTLLVTTPQTKIEAKAVRNIVPNAIEGWHIQVVPSGSLGQAVTAPDVTLVQIDDATKPADLRALMPHLVHIQSIGVKRSHVLFHIKKLKGKMRAHKSKQQPATTLIGQISSQLASFPDPSRVSLTFAPTKSDLLTQLGFLNTVVDLQPTEPSAPAPAPRPSPLDKVKEALQATQDLRVSSGKLSAEAVVVAFGLSVNQLATSLGRSRQALGKTPDADAIQDQLAFFERVARLRAVLPKEQFLKWLRMPNPELDGQTPLALLADGDRQVVADLVDDMLTGAPA